METVWKDIRYGARMLIKSPGITVIAALTIAVGVGTGTALFSVVNAVLIEPLPYPDPDRLVWIWEVNPANGIEQEPASVPNFLDWTEQNTVFDSIAGTVRQRPIVTGHEGPELIVEEIVTPAYFDVLGVAPTLGRGFNDEDAIEGNHRVVVITHGFWQRRFGGDRNVIGSMLTLSDRPYTVIGVMPAAFRPLQPETRQLTEVYRPLSIDLEVMTRRADFLGVIARLKPGLTRGQAQAEMDAISARLAEEFPDANAGWSTRILPLHERLSGSVRPSLLILLGAVAFLLLIVCANVANLMLTRASGRSKEIAIRTAMGAARGRLVRQLLTESTLLSLAGGGAGVLLGVWFMEGLDWLRPPDVHGIDQVVLDARVLLVALGLSLITGLLFGILPAINATRNDPHDNLKEGGRGGADAGASGRRLRSLLAVSEVALALLLLIGAMLMIRSLARLQTTDPGFRTDGLHIATLQIPRARYSEMHQITGFYDDLLTRLEALPGVTAVSAGSALPHRAGSYLAFAVEGRPLPPSEQVVDAVWGYTTPGYFETLGIPLIRGRLPTHSDTETSTEIAVINQAMVSRYWPGEDPVGQRITLNDPVEGPWMTIVGIVADTKNVGLDSAAYPAIYQPHAQVGGGFMRVLIESESPPEALAGAVRGAIREVDPDQPLTSFTPLADSLAESLSARRFNMLLFSIFAGIALLLAGIGIYGVVSYAVSQRSHEIGIRMALGAQRGDVLRLIAKQGLGLTLTGLVIGLALALGLTQVLSSLLFGVSVRDPLSFFGTATLLLTVAMLATWVPARRATRVDPISSLRCE